MFWTTKESVLCSAKNLVISTGGFVAACAVGFYVMPTIVPVAAGYLLPSSLVTTVVAADVTYNNSSFVRYVTFSGLMRPFYWAANKTGMAVTEKALDLSGNAITFAYDAASDFVHVTGTSVAPNPAENMLEKPLLGADDNEWVTLKLSDL